MKITKAANTAAKRIFRMCCVNGSLQDESLRRAIAMLVERQPRDYHAILVALKRLVRLELERKHVIVESAVVLDETERQRAISSVTSTYGHDLTFEFSEQPELIGGLRIQVGNDLLDGSVKGRIDRLTEAFS